MMHQDDGWDGQERRSIPIHILNHINQTVDDLRTEMNQRFTVVEDRIVNLTNSINAWMDREPKSIVESCEKMLDEAIPTHRDNPDATPAEKRKEHRRAHAKWIAHVEEELEKWDYLRKEAMKWAVGATLSGLVFWVLWSIAKYTER